MPPPASSLARVSTSTPRGVTLLDVANEAGVSKITASRAISNPGMVTEATRLKVQQAASRIGYVPNFVAGSLKSRRSRLIACVVPTIASGSVFLPAVRAMTQAFERLGYHVMLAQRGYGQEQENEQIETVLARRPDGIVLTGTFSSAAARRKLKASGLPVMEMWDMARSPIDMLVGFSHEAAGRAAAAYLHGKGRRHVAMISANEPRSAAREAGFVGELQRLGLPAPRIETIAPPTRMGHGRVGLAALLKADPRIDAVFCTTDMVALGVTVEAQLRNLDVPRRLAVMGFGDMDFAADASPALTTIRIDNEQLGEQAATLLVEAIDGRRSKRVLDMGFEVVERASA
ncbi:MAG: LacI family DNA-binding transcriptional regulator [Proteobacteria bacterium]|nr:LacI family DNA-binding transcriptional regulator [Pseudomonadota bacterium]